MKKIILTISFIALLSHVFAQEQKPPKEVADGHFIRYEYAQAALIYQHIARKKKNVKTTLLENLATCYREMNRYDAAAEWYAKAIARDDAKPEDWLYYGDALKSKGQFDDAIRQYEIYAQKTGNPESVRIRIDGCKQSPAWITAPTSVRIRNASGFNSSRSDWGTTYFHNSLVFVSDSLRRDELDRRSRRNRSLYGWNRHNYLRLLQVDSMGNGYLRVKDFSPELNKYKYHTGPVVFSRNYDTAYFTVTNPDRNPGYKKVKRVPLWGTRRLELYASIFKDGKWQSLNALPYNKPKEYSVGHAALSQDGSILYFASDMPGGQGGTDIWYSEKQGDGSWGTPKNCGTVLNTVEDDEFPTINNGVLYYSSKGLTGMGGFDIFAAKGQRDQWNAPENLRFPINSTGDDFYYLSDGRTGYLSSNRSGGKGGDDIYTFLNPDEITALPPFKPGLYITLRATICNPGCVYLFNKTRGIGWCFVADSDGKFTQLLEGNSEYVIRNYSRTGKDSLEFNTNGIVDPQVLEESLCPVKAPVNTPVLQEEPVRKPASHKKHYHPKKQLHHKKQLHRTKKH